METVRIFDTTLRDGEQSPGATLTRPEKMEIARHLESMGVDIIEAGFPIASEGDFESVRAIAQEISRSVVCGLARCTPKDIERAGEAVKDAAKARIHVFCATSKIHREFKLVLGGRPRGIGPQRPALGRERPDRRHFVSAAKRRFHVGQYLVDVARLTNHQGRHRQDCHHESVHHLAHHSRRSF